MNKTAVAVIVIAVLIGGGYWFFSSQPGNVDESSSMSEEKEKMMSEDSPGEMMENQEMMEDDKMGDDSMMDKPVTIKFTSSGFEPSEVTVKKGESVKWVNESSISTWPASANHPSHVGYPTTGGCLGSTFDACKGLAKGESWTFQFDFFGTWNYHDHLNPTRYGKVIVGE
ncbi:MAG: hypothetical protein HY397_01030 [Candidatus Doudnabacteria bacterium]|nr:hypothetical protein [Candidatus Doudnabacteria bacterium]